MARRLRAWDVARRFPGTLGIIALTLLFFALEHALGGGTDLRAQLRLGALRPDRIAEHHEAWRLVMPMFLHHGAIHLLLNGFALVQLGPLVESLWGTRRLVAFYVACGIAGSLASAAFTTGGYAAAVGASGAIMGLAGVLLGATRFGEPSVRAFLGDLLGRRLLTGVLLTLALGAALLLVVPVVDNWAHVGGLVGGVLISLAHPDPIDRDDPGNTVGAAVAAGVVAVALGFTAVRGGDALDTVEIDTARLYSVRASQTPGGFTTPGVLVEMLAWYDRAHAAEEGLDRFGRAVEKIDQPLLLATLADSFVGEIDAGTDRDMPMLLVLERWRRLAPEDPTVANALAWHLVTRSNEALRDPARAEILSRESLAAIPDPDSGGGRDVRAAFLDTLAEILLQQGRLEEAHAAQVEAVAIATERALDVLPELQARLDRIVAARSAG